MNHLDYLYVESRQAELSRLANQSRTAKLASSSSRNALRDFLADRLVTLGKTLAQENQTSVSETELRLQYLQK